MSLTKQEIPLATVPQRNFSKGLNATSPVFDQPKGTVSRLSNLLLTKRGGFVITPGSQQLYLFNGAVQSNVGPFTELFLFQPSLVSRYYVGLTKDYNFHTPAPVGLTSADNGAGGLLSAGTYKWGVTALDGAGGETTVSNITTLVLAAGHSVNLSWTAVTNAVGYNIYRTAANGVPLLHVTNWGLTTYLDNIPDSGLGVFGPPAVNTTQTCIFYVFPNGAIPVSYVYANGVFVFPADAVIVPGDTTGGYGGSGGHTGGSGGSGTPAGSVIGNLSPLPQFLQFDNEVILCLGNGISPYYFPDGGVPTAISNTFQAAYPNWVASTQYVGGGINPGPNFNGDVILPLTNNAGGYIFQCTQGGTSGTGNPTFPQFMGGNVADNNVIWHNSGQKGTVPAPRGAAHGIVYAGSLWLANTSPSTTTDQLDGPCVLKMSDVDNPNSWNPLNVAFIGKDDGTQITGLAAFTIAETGIAPVGSMVVFKDFDTYQVVGVFGATDFSIQKAQTDLGCIAPRSIQFLPGFGVARLTHLGVAIFDGVRDRLISEDIRPYLFGGESDITPLDWNFAYFSKGAQAAVPPMYVLAIPIQLGLPVTVPTPDIAVYPYPTSTLPVGNYFIKVTIFLGSTESAVCAEQGPFSVGAGQAIVVYNNYFPVGITKWRIYFGTATGMENQYIDVIAPLTAGFLTAPGTSGYPASGNGGLTRLLCYDMVLKSWTIVDLPWPISVLKQFRAEGTIPITVSGGFSDLTIRRLLAQDPDWDDTPITWLVRTPEVFGKYTNQRSLFRRLTIRGISTGDPLIKVTISYDGGSVAQQAGRFYQLGSGYFELQIDLLNVAMSAHANITGTSNSATLPLEIHAFDWEVQPRIPGIPVSI